jgi:DNA-binding beta-propeller fold protein YncE
MRMTPPTSHLRRALAAAVAALALLAIAPAAQAAPGDLGFDGCITGDGSFGCADLPLNPLQRPSDVAFSPDGRSAYAVAFSGDTILHWFRGPGGELSYDGCVNNDGSQGCTDAPGTPLDGASAVTVSPDGRSVYVTGANQGTVVHFTRLQPGGQVVFAGCLGDTTAGDACGIVPGLRLGGASDVAVSPDGTSVYVAAGGAGTVSHFYRDADGRLHFGSCVASEAGTNCTDLPAEPLGDPRAVTVSPDGRSVYVAARRSNAVAHFFRAPGGQMHYDGCLSQYGTHGCADVRPLAGPSDVAVSRDGRSVYVTAATSNTVTHLDRLLPDGQIVFRGCVADRGEYGCADLPGLPLGQPRAIALSPDGSSAYVAAFTSGAVTRLALRADGTPAFAGCLESGNDHGCTTSRSPLPLLVDALAVSPDNRSVLAVANTSALARFSVERRGAGGAAGGGGGGGKGGQGRSDTAAPRVSGLRAFVRRGAPTLRFRLSEPARVRVVLQRTGPGGRRSTAVGRAVVRRSRAGVSTLALPRRRLGSGRYRVRVVATDASGNRSAARTARLRRR